MDTPFLLNLYLISQTERDDYDTYDACVVAALSAEAASQIHPDSWRTGEWWKGEVDSDDSWASSPANVRVRWIGTAIEGTKAGVVLASFHSG